MEIRLDNHAQLHNCGVGGDFAAAARGDALAADGNLRVTSGEYRAPGEVAEIDSVPAAALSRDDGLGRLFAVAFDLPAPPMPPELSEGR